MTGLYNHKWVAACGDLPVDNRGHLTLVGALWAEGLAGFSPLQLRAALCACINRADTWPPVLSEFRALCLGIPSLQAVRADIGKRSLGFTRLVWQHLDHFAFTRNDQRTSDRLLSDAYDYARERRMCGDEYPDAPAQLTQDKPAPFVAPPPRERTTVLERAREALR